MSLYQVNAGDRILAADSVQFYNILKGVAASGETITLVYNAAASLVFQPSSDPAAATEAVQVKNNAGTVQSALSFDGRAYLADGLVGTPSHAFESEKTTGLYRISAGVEGFAILGVERMRLSASGLSLDGGTTFLGSNTFAPADLVGRFAWDWNGRVAVETTLTGTGAITAGTLTLAYTLLSTGATSGSTAGMRAALNVASPAAGVNKVRLLKFSLQYGNIDANTTTYIYMTDESATGAPSATARHLGIRQSGATINFTTGDNTTEQTTDISSAFAANVANNVDITFDGTTARCYVAGVLKATHATNVPGASSANPVFRAYITNSAAADKLLYLATARAVFSV